MARTPSSKAKTETTAATPAEKTDAKVVKGKNTTAKEPPKRDWGQSKYEGRKVFTPKGTGTVLKEDTGRGRILIKVSKTEHDFSMKSVRFKAIDDKYRDRYTADKKARTPGGSASINNGDPVARSMAGLEPAQVATIAAENGLAEKWESWGHLNYGMRRMNLGNSLRRMWRKSQEEGSEVKAPTILGKPVEEAADAQDRDNESHYNEVQTKKAEKAKEAAQKKKSDEAKKANKEAEPKAA